MKASMTSTVEVALATEPQWKQIERVIEDAGPKAAKIIRKKCLLDSRSAQVVVISGNQIQDAMIDAGLAKIRELTMTNEFASEVVESKYDYPPEYSLKPIGEQVEALKAAFPGLSTDQTMKFIQEVLPTMELPAGAEGHFAIPRWDKIAATYGEALEEVFKVLVATWRFQNYREGQLAKQWLRQCARTVAYLERLMRDQPGDIIIVPAQFGRLHKGESVRRAREIFQVNEFGLGGFAVGCMIIAHPERAVRWEELDMDCPGDEYSPEADGDFSDAPFFHFHDDELLFNAGGVGFCYDSYGSVSGFLPQSSLETLGN